MVPASQTKSHHGQCVPVRSLSLGSSGTGWLCLSLGLTVQASTNDSRGRQACRAFGVPFFPPRHLSIFQFILNPGHAALCPPPLHFLLYVKDWWDRICSLSPGQAKEEGLPQIWGQLGAYSKTPSSKSQRKKPHEPMCTSETFWFREKGWVGAFQFHTERQASGVLWLVESPTSLKCILSLISMQYWRLQVSV